MNQRTCRTTRQQQKFPWSLVDDMSTRLTILWKCLICVAALFSPLQALQATHAVCFCSHRTACLEEQSDTSAPPSRCPCCRKSAARSNGETNPQGFLAVGQSGSSCPCPPSCSCHRPGESNYASQPTVEPTPPAPSFAQAPGDCADALGQSEPELHNTVRTRAITAHQRCATLCRFLA